MKLLLKSYVCDDEVNKNINQVFDYILKEKAQKISQNREKRKKLKTTGGYAPGFSVLKDSLDKIRNILYNKKNNEKLSSLEVHDIICHIAESVYTGGIRRSACIRFFSEDDQSMLFCQSGNDWFVTNKQRCRANNSVVLLRSTLDMDKFYKYMDIIKANRTGEPGMYLTNDLNIASNPCLEISLNPFQPCNLTETNCSNIESQEYLNERCNCAAFITTLQAMFRYCLTFGIGRH